LNLSGTYNKSEEFKLSDSFKDLPNQRDMKKDTMLSILIIFKK